MATATASAPGGTSLYVRTRLSVMMFLQYAIWGAWLPILYPFISGHRKFSDGEVSAVFAARAAGAVLGPVVAGQLADRKFATERMLALSHLVGAGLVWFLAETSEF
ncbi:MAG: MFS transporter, partial [Phycisphaerales bacterium]